MTTVLVVEDDPDIGKLILLLLARAGIEATLRTDGPAGLAAESDRARALALGADGFVLKPFRNDALVAELRALLPAGAAGSPVGGVR